MTDRTVPGLDDYGEFGKIAPLLVLLGHLRSAALDDGARWIFPADVLPGVTQAYGLDVVRADVPDPMIGVRPGD